MRPRRVTATLAGLALVIALAVVGFAGGAAARSAPSTHVYVNHAGAVRHTGHVVLPAKFRRLIRRALTHTRSLQSTSFTDTCIGGTRGPTDDAGHQNCTISSPTGACIQITSVSDATQNCIVMQTTGHRNIAIVVQIITQRSSGPSGTQNGSQRADITQQNTTYNNLSFVVQIAKQFLGTGSDAADSEVTQEAPVEAAGETYGVLPNFTPLASTLASQESLQEGPEPATSPSFGAAVTQTQQLQQIANVCQGGTVSCDDPTGMTGSNLSSVYQSSRQRERARNAVSIDQQQNPQDGACPNAALDGNTTNMCAIVDQHTTGGRNTSGLVELYRQFQSAINAGSTTQQQDPAPFEGGFDHDIHQESVGATPGKEIILTLQRGRQIQRVTNGGTVDQFQDPVGRKGAGSFQTGTPNDTWNGSLAGTQLQFQDGAFASGGLQTQELTYNGTSTGTINATVTGTENGNTATAQCPGTGPSNTCDIAVQCQNGNFGDAPTTFSETGPFCEPTPNVPPETSTDTSTIG